MEADATAAAAEEDTACCVVGKDMDTVLARRGEPERPGSDSSWRTRSWGGQGGGVRGQGGKERVCRGSKMGGRQRGIERWGQGGKKRGGRGAKEWVG